MSKDGRVKRHYKTPIRSSDYQTLGECIKYLRSKQKPYMSQPQLAHIARVSMQTLIKIENDSDFDVRLATLRRISWALGRGLFIKIKSKPSPGTGECLLSNPELPPPPKRTGRTSVKGRELAAKYGRSPWRSYRRRIRRAPNTKTSDTPDSAVTEQNPFEAE